MKNSIFPNFKLLLLLCLFLFNANSTLGGSSIGNSSNEIQIELNRNIQPSSKKIDKRKIKKSRLNQFISKILAKRITKKLEKKKLHPGSILAILSYILMLGLGLAIGFSGILGLTPFISTLFAWIGFSDSKKEPEKYDVERAKSIFTTIVIIMLAGLLIGLLALGWLGSLGTD